LGIVLLVVGFFLHQRYKNRPYVPVPPPPPGVTLDGDPKDAIYQPENLPLLAAAVAGFALGAVGIGVGLIGITIELKGGAPFATVARGFEVTRRGGSE